MKKLIMLGCLASFILFANAQKIDAAKVPAAVTGSFEKKYPGTAAKWEKEDGNYEVNFKKNGNSMSAVINTDGTIMETEMDIKIAELPTAILHYVKENYKGKTIKEGAKITKADGTVNYEAEVAGKDVIFDADGKFIKEVKD
jgi:Putative beta-lactamase-inhibitor-like, PepSY-like